MATIGNKHSRSVRMKKQHHLKVLAVCVASALVQLGAGDARADSAVGVDTALGNAMNPPGRSAVPRPLLEEDGFDTVRRSPSGQLYGIPYDRSDEGSNKTESGWQYSGGIEAGVLSSDAKTKNALFRKYKDLHSGVYLDYFEVEAYHPENAGFMQAFGGGIGNHDQFYATQFGQFNGWKVKLFFNETRHVYTDTYKALYNGTGTGNLTLAGGLQPNGGATPVTAGLPNVGAGACTAAAPCWRYTDQTGTTRVFANNVALAGINWTGNNLAAPQPIGQNSIAGSINSYLGGVSGDAELAVTRKKGGVMADIRLADRWKAYAGYTLEERKGARPFAMNENNYTVEIPEPIDYTTHDFVAGLSYAEPLMQANLRASASVFRNNISALTVQQPWLAAATGIAAAQTTIFDLYPDNKAFNLKGEFARNLPDMWKGRFTANAAWGTSRQDDTLMMPIDPSQSSQISAAMGSTVAQGIQNAGYATNSLNLNNWNGVNGMPLSQSSGKQRIDTTLLNLGLAFTPVDDLDIKGDYRYYKTDNKGGYMAYNPLTGQFGRGFRNSTAFDLVVGSSGAPGAIGVPCYVPPGFPAVAGCTFNGNAGVAGQSTNNPANIPVFNPPRDTRQINYSLSADYDLGKPWGNVSGTLEREDFHRTYRERDKTWEDKIKLAYVNRAFEEATVRLSFEEARRRGSKYEFWPVGDMGTGLPGLDWNTIWNQYVKAAAAAPGWTVAPAALQGYFARYAYEARKADQADRNQQVVNTRVNLMPRSDLDLGIMFQFKNVTFPDSGYGLETDRLKSLNFDINYQPSTVTQVFGYYSIQDGKRSMRANSGTTVNPATGLSVNNTCFFATGSTLTLEQALFSCAQQMWKTTGIWNLDTHDLNNSIGFGFQTSVWTMRLGVDFAYSESKSSVAYRFGSGVLTPVQALAAGAAFPDMTLAQNTITAHLMIPVEKKISAHLLYRHESGRIKDWHYANLPIGASAAENQATLMLDAGPQNYHTNVYGVLFQFKL